MFRGASNLSLLAVKFASWNGDATQDWVYGVAERGEFYCDSALGTQTTMERGSGRVPADWTVYNDHAPLCFSTAEGCRVAVDDGGRGDLSIEMSLDGSSWFDYGNGWVDVPANGSLLVRANLSNQTFRGAKFQLSGAASLSGSLQSLLLSEGWRKDVPEYCFAGVFQGCTGLVEADVFGDGEELSPYCYMNALSGCSSLSAPPAIPAVPMAAGCFQNAFAGTNLSSLPPLPSGGWAEDCFAGFMRSTPLVSARIDVKDPPTGSLDSAFAGCSGLSSVEVKFKAWGDFTDNWLADVSETGEFTCPKELGDGETIARGPSRCPVSWTVAAPAVEYIRYIQGRSDTGSTALGVTPRSDMCCTYTVSCDNSGAFWLFAGGDDPGVDSNWRPFNLGSGFYFDWNYLNDTNRATLNTWLTNQPNAVSCWNFGCALSNATYGVQATDRGPVAPNSDNEISVIGYGDGSRWGFLRIYGLKFWYGDALVRDLRPAVKDGEAGLWDEANGVFYAPDAGSWLSGPSLAPDWETSHVSVWLNNEWRYSPDVPNPDPSALEGPFESDSNWHVQNAAAWLDIRVDGLDTFEMYLRSDGESGYDYATAYEPDDDNTVKASTANHPNAGTALSDYDHVVYTGLGGTPHTIRVKYAKDGSADGGQDRAWVLIPKNQ